MTPVILIHYHEIALKGKNRPYFEKKLVNHLKNATDLKEVNLDYGRILIPLKNKFGFEKTQSKLEKIPGIANFAFAWQTKRDFAAIQRTSLKIIKNKKFSRFRVTSSRADKKYPLTSEEINRRLGAAIIRKYQKKVDLNQPDLTVYVEINSKHAYVYLTKYQGLGGLPATTAGKILCLLSGGIDSPVAAWQMIRRGAQVDLVHFHSYPRTNRASIEKVKKISQILKEYQLNSKLFLVPLIELQKELFGKCNHRYLVILYRRAMFRIAAQIAAKEGSLGLVTGESLGQVASQTLENMAAASSGITLPIYRPLIGFDKQAIILLAKKIGTYQISIQPHQDCCSLFIPKHPVTKAKPVNVINEENKVNLTKLISHAQNKITIH